MAPAPFTVFDTKLACPRTVVAASSVVNGYVNSRTLLLPESATHRLPEESKAIPAGCLATRRSGRPRWRRSRTWKSGRGRPSQPFRCRTGPLRRGRCPARTRVSCSPESTTHRLPEESNMASLGL